MSSLSSFYYFQDFMSFELNTLLVRWCEAIKGEGNLAEFIKLIAVKWQRELTL